MNALLLGSGISVNAGVPSGKAVTCELIERLAKSLKQDTHGDPIGWYREHADHEPDYRTLLAEAVPSPADRRNLLSKHFEPRSADGDVDGPMPTRAHRAVARLVADGFVRVIVTTNFDRLLETALTEAGVHAQVIYNAATAESAEPLQHSRCTVIKVNGDYVSSGIRNTAEELASYEPAINGLLARVFEEYGLIVCGWSASLDTALSEAILRATNRNYSTFWMDRGNLSAEATDLIAHRQATRVPIEDADTAFEHLADTVTALSQAPQQRPASATAAIQQIKLHLSDPSHYIRLHDLMVRETESLIDAVAELPMTGGDLGAVFPERMHMYEIATTPLMALLATGAYFSRNDEHDQAWATAIDRLANRQSEQTGATRLLELQQYPTLLAMYATAIGAAAADRIEPIARILGTVEVTEDNEKMPVSVVVCSTKILSYGMMRATVPGLERHKVPHSQRLYDVLRPTVQEIIPDDRRYEKLFDQIEYLFGFAFAFQSNVGMGPIGMGAFRRLVGFAVPPDELVQGHLEVLVNAGVFTNSDDLKKCRDNFNEQFRITSRQAW